MTDKGRTLSQRREELMVKVALQREQFVSQISGLAPSSRLLTRAKDASAPSSVSSVAGKTLLSGVLLALGFLFARRKRLVSIVAASSIVLQGWRYASLYIFPLVRGWRQRRTK
ncbi:MAG: hypothetical protein LBK01_06990 [Burkholderiaceae bacterium]|jgi:hypothetical protein|nr:hypothetical protein [Burkholderiaceae bacterium]